MSTGRVLVTGATGLIGRHLAAPLAARGYEVVTLSRHRGDLCGDLIADPEGVAERAGADHLLHLAWHDAPTGRWTAAENLDWVVATLRLLRAFARHGGRRAVLVGSCAEYDWSGAGRLSETAPLRPAGARRSAGRGAGHASSFSSPRRV
jgi:nucleoside-diphosphate-sugar epimerase